MKNTLKNKFKRILNQILMFYNYFQLTYANYIDDLSISPSEPSLKYIKKLKK